MSGKPLASISLDLDNLWSYLKIHGDCGWETFPSFFDLIIPDVLDILNQLGLKITFFIVGQDALLDKNLDSLRALTEQGHELANHSFHHEPRFHLSPRSRIETEILTAHEQIMRLGAPRPLGFRGPGFGWSREVIEVLAENDYLYDASTLPTYIGPLARAYYFKTSNLTEKDRWERRNLFGSFREGFRSNKAYIWQVESGLKLLEIPVTTLPLIKLPFHLSYLLYLGRVSVALMFMYLEMGLILCRATKIAPSFLLHPLDFLDTDKIPELGFFPGMRLSLSRKVELFYRVIRILSGHFELVMMSTCARAILNSGNIKIESI